MRLLPNPLSRRWLEFVGIVLLMQIQIPAAVSQLRNPDLTEATTLAEVATEVTELTSQPLDDDAIHRLIEIDEAFLDFRRKLKHSLTLNAIS